jgi:hypothetical protein
MLLPRRAAAFWEGPEGFTGRNRESRSREAAGRRNYPEAVPKEMWRKMEYGSQHAAIRNTVVSADANRRAFPRES